MRSSRLGRRRCAFGPSGSAASKLSAGSNVVKREPSALERFGPCRLTSPARSKAPKRLRGKGRQRRVRRSQPEPLDYIKIVIWVIGPYPRRASGRGRRSFATGRFRSASPTGGVVPHDQPRLFDFPYEEASLKSITIGKFIGIFR